MVSNTRQFVFALRIFIFSWFIFNSSSGFAQFGLSAYYSSITAGSWEDVVKNTEWNMDRMSGYELAADGYYRLKNYRIEFFPEIRLGAYSFNEGKARINSAGVFVKTHFYIFNLEGDCDCPTFSKKEPFFRKGFFLFVAPGLRRLELPSLSAAYSKPPASLGFALGIGAGVDFGVSDLVTISPTIGYYQSFGHDWVNLDKMVNADLPSVGGDTHIKSGFGSFNAGVRVGFRFDYKRPFSKNRRR